MSDLFLPLQWNLCMYSGVIFLCVFLFLLVFIMVTNYYGCLRVATYVKAEEYATSILLAVLSFNVFYLHYALLIWLILYVIYGFLENENRSIRYILKLCTDVRYKATRKQLQLYDQIVENITDKKRNAFGLFIAVLGLKKMAHAVIKSEAKKEALWLNSFLPPKIYLIGLIIPTVNSILGKKGNIYTEYWWYTLLEGCISLLTILLLAYPIMRFLTVKNEGHLLYGCEKTFKTLFLLVSILLFAILIGITTVR